MLKLGQALAFNPRLPDLKSCMLQSWANGLATANADLSEFDSAATRIFYMVLVSDSIENGDKLTSSHKELNKLLSKNWLQANVTFLAPLGKGKQGYITALCQSCMRTCVRQPVCSCLHNFYFKHLLY